MIFSNNIYNRIEHVGLSITPNAVRLVISDKLGKIRTQAEIQAQQPYIEGDNANGETLTQALIDVMKQAKSNTAYAAVCFPEKLAYSREHILPKLSTREISEAIRWQLGTIFPVNPDDIYYDWKLLLQSENETKIVVTAVSKKLLDGIRESCLAAGIKPISFESSASVLARAITTLPEQAIITEVDSFGSSSTLVENGVSSLTATTNFSQNGTSEAVLQDIVISIKHLLGRIKTPITKETPPLIYITGEKSSPKLAEILSGQLGQGVTELNVNQVPANYHIPYVESRTNVEAPESEKTINLLPELLQQMYRGEAELTHAKKTTLIGVAIGGFACLIALGVLLTISILSSRAATKLASIAAPPNVPTDINVPLIMQKAQKITSLQVVKKNPTESMNNAISIIEGSPLRQFDYAASTKTIRISLAGIGRAALFDLKDGFEASGKFGPVAIPLSALGSETAEAVTLSIVIKDK